MGLQIKVVMGAGYGDEGKGLMTDYFCRELKSCGLKVLNIKTNGGAQAGHTVCALDKEYKHWVFKQYGSGTFAGADTYMLNTFMLNISELLKERKYLKEIYKINNKVYIDRRCRVTLPMDVLMNRLIEDKRTNRHGSCGLGIYETFHRNNDLFTIELKDLINKFISLNIREFDKWLKNIAEDYYKVRLNEIKYSDNIEINEEEYRELMSKTLVMNTELIDNIAEIAKIDDIIFCNSLAELINIEKYSGIVFECSQGLELDQFNKRNWPHLTPSNTGLLNVVNELFSNKHTENSRLECCFITRSYKTKHGAGVFLEEDTNIQNEFGLYDRTNQPNQYQGILKYGRLNLGRLKNLIIEQTKYLDKINNLENKEVSLAVTHLDQTNGLMLTQLGNIHFSDIFEIMKKVSNKYYLSFGEKATDIIKQENNSI